MPVEIGAKPLASFDQPIDLLMDCHRRVERFLQVFLDVATSSADGSLSPPLREALATALEYFKRAAPRHTQDEEHSLFPRLRESTDPRAAEVLAKMDRLEADHQRVAGSHQQLETLGHDWLAAGHIPPDQQQQFAEISRSLIAAYREHIRCEDEEVFPLAREILSLDALQQIGQEMRQRRVNEPGRPGGRCAERRVKAFS